MYIISVQIITFKNATYSLGLGIFENEFFEINLDYLNNSKLSRFTALEFITSKSLIIDPLYNKFIDNCNQNNIKLELYFKADKTNINDFDVIIDYCVSKSIKLCILDIDKKATTNKLSKHEYKKIFKKAKDVCFREKHSKSLFKDLTNIRVAPDIVFGLNTEKYKNVV